MHLGPSTHPGSRLALDRHPSGGGILQRWLRMDFGIELDKSKVGVKMVRLLRALWAVLAAKHCGSHRKSAILK